MRSNTEILKALLTAREVGNGIHDVHQAEAFQAGIIETADRLGLIREYAQAVKETR